MKEKFNDNLMEESRNLHQWCNLLDKITSADDSFRKARIRQAVLAQVRNVVMHIRMQIMEREKLLYYSIK